MAKSSDQLNLVEIANLTGFARGTLNRFLEYPEVRDWLGGANTHPLYPADQIERMHEMFRASQRGIKPRPFAISLENYVDVSYTGGPSDAEGEDNALTARLHGEPGALATLPTTSLATSLATSFMPSSAAIGDAADVFGARFGNAVIELLKSSRILPAAEDRLLTREEAAQLLACKPTAVGRRVPPVLPETWSHRMIQDYIASLVVAAGAKAAKKRQEKADR